MADTTIELLQFEYSHFNEKARWALDFKRTPHARTSFLPGPHAPRIKRLTGETTVPVVRFGDQIVAGSARIIDELERRFPEPSLYPRSPADRTRALDIQKRFDAEVGPAVRRGLFAALLQTPGLFKIMRTAISIPNDLFERDERLALRLVISRREP